MVVHEYHTNDSPNSPGHEPQDGEVCWSFVFSLFNGDRLKLFIGRDTRKEMIDVLLQENIDDVILK